MKSAARALSSIWSKRPEDAAEEEEEKETEEEEEGDAEEDLDARASRSN